MKRVHVVVGGAALAPAALGIALPAAHAATAAPGTANGKTVSLYHTGTTPDTGCTGSTEFTIPQSGHVRGHGWQTGNDASRCVGTVVVSLYFTKGTTGNKFCKNAIGSVSAINRDYGKSHQVCGTAGHWVHTSFSVHERFDIPFAVCASSTYAPGRTCKLFVG